MSAGDVLIRRLDVTVRRGEDDGLLVETLIGRYLLDRDARRVWDRVDGTASVGAISAAVAGELGAAPDAVAPAVASTCERLAELGLVEPVARSRTGASA
jgi:hypothetical protein